MKNEEIKHLYYFARRNMNKYIYHYVDIHKRRYYENECHQIVGFYYINNQQYGLIVTDDSYWGDSIYYIRRNWKGINIIFLNKKNQGKYKYARYLLPLMKGYEIVDKKILI